MPSNAMNFVIRSVLTAAAFSVVAIDALAEPPSCYAGRPAVLPAPMDYGVAYQRSQSTVVYADPPAYASYRRTYSSPAYENKSARVVYASRQARCETPVVLDTTYYTPAYERVSYAPRRIVHVRAPYYYGHRRHYRYSGDHYYRPRHFRLALGHARHGHHRYYRHHHGNRRWGVSVGYGSGHHGRRGGFSFYYGR